MTGESALLIVGSLGRGSYGPTILLKLESPLAVQWLRDLISAIPEGVEPVMLEKQPGVRIGGVRQLELDLVKTSPRKHLRRVDHDRFIWSGSAGDWVEVAMLLDPFLEGRTGHQYLTSETDDDAIIEVSFGEPEVRVGQ